MTSEQRQAPLRFLQREKHVIDLQINVFTLNLVIASRLNVCMSMIFHQNDCILENTLHLLGPLKHIG